jgi:hypothetical protein
MRDAEYIRKRKILNLRDIAPNLLLVFQQLYKEFSSGPKGTARSTPSSTRSIT